MKKLATISITIALVVIGFIAGTIFSQSRIPTAPAPTIVPAVTMVAPGDSIITFLEPVEGTSEPKPQLTVIAKIRDATTGKPVVASRLILEGKVIAEGVSEFTFMLPGEVLDYIILEVQAPGYEQWQVGIRHKLKHNSTYELPVNLDPKLTKPVSPV